MLKMKCCGQERTTKFCPECGKKLEHPLSALYRHLDGVVKIDEAKLDSVKKDKKLSENVVLYKRRIARVFSTLAKWTSWRDAVRNAIGEAQSVVESEEKILPIVDEIPPTPPTKKPAEKKPETAK